MFTAWSEIKYLATKKRVCIVTSPHQNLILGILMRLFDRRKVASLRDIDFENISRQMLFR